MKGENKMAISALPPLTSTSLSPTTSASGRKKVHIKDVFEHSKGRIAYQLDYNSLYLLRCVSKKANEEVDLGVRKFLNKRKLLQNTTQNLINIKNVAYLHEADAFLKSIELNNVNESENGKTSLEHVLLNTELSTKKKKFIIFGLLLLDFNIDNFVKSIENNNIKDNVKRDIANNLVELHPELFERALEIVETIEDDTIKDYVKRDIANNLVKLDSELIDRALEIVETIENDTIKDNVKTDIAKQVGELHSEFTNY